jgi:hypothetical protein
MSYHEEVEAFVFDGTRKVPLRYPDVLSLQAPKIIGELEVLIPLFSEATGRDLKIVYVQVTSRKPLSVHAYKFVVARQGAE